MSRPRRILVAQEMTTDIGQETLRGAVQASGEYPDWTVWKTGNGPRDKLMEKFRTTVFDGAIVHAASDGLVHALTALDIPIISTSNAPPTPTLPQVCTDDVAAGQMAGTYLRELGYREVHFIGRSESIAYVAQRLAGLRDIFGDDAVHMLTFRGTPARWVTYCHRVVSQSITAPAIVAADDRLAEHIVAWAYTEGIAIPGQMTVMGFNNEFLRCDVAHPPITSVELPFEKIGAVAFRRIVDMVEGRADPRDLTPVLLPPLGVVERQSTAVGAVTNPTVRAALAEIRRTHGRTTVNQLVEKLTITRRALELGFREWVGDSPHQFILKTRAENARRLLADTPMTITQIAHAAGFSGPTQLGKVFHKFFNASPTEVRRQFVEGR